MSIPNQPSNNIEYDPLPLTSNEQDVAAPYNPINPAEETLYQHPSAEPLLNASPPPSSPNPNSPAFHTPQMELNELPPETEDSIPIGAPTPRFLGAAMYNEGGPVVRDSYASSHQTSPSAGGGSDFQSSIYALNDTVGSSRLSDTLYSNSGGYRDDPRGSYFANEQGGLPMSSMGDRPGNRYLEEKRGTYTPPRTKSKRKIFLLAILGSLILLILVVVIPVYFAVVKPKGNKSNATGGQATSKPSSTGKPTVKPAVSGGDGSTITLEDGSTFIYSNKFGGTWYWDPEDPFNDSAQPQSWTPALNQTFQYGVNKIRGVNIGGWLNTEPFITPALYEPYANTSSPAIDEWTLSLAMAANGGIQQLVTHYETFITEQDFAQIAGAGLNYVRIPLPYWAIETRTGEPFLAKTSWTYFLKAIQWARKYGLRINLDFHALPGSQNGWNHSGRLGSINVLNGPMGYANAQRSLDYIRILAEFISQPQYSNVVTMFGVTNEPEGSTIGMANLQSYYLKAYDVVRAASGVGVGNGPFISYHDGFFSKDQWAGFLPNADRVSLDDHPYLCFGSQSSSPMSSYATTPCSVWASDMNNSMAGFGLSGAGEWSNAVTDCGLWVNGVNEGARYDGTYNGDGQSWPHVGSCTTWTNWQNYDSGTTTAIQNFALASMDALQNWFFWTWKIGNSSVSGTIESPAWSYQLGLQQGWMPSDPRSANGVCGNSAPWVPPLSAWQTGGSGAGNIPASVTSALAWPPASLSNAGAITLLPSYTPTGAVPTLPAPTFTSVSSTHISAGNGWENPSDTAGLMVNIATCSYLNPWVGPTNPPSPLCGASKREDQNDLDVAPPIITSPPTI